MKKPLTILGNGIALYAIGMGLAWLAEQPSFGLPSFVYELAMAVLVLVGVCTMIVGAILVGLKLTTASRVAGGAGMTLVAFGLPWLWNRGIDVLGPNVHGWSAGFLLLPVLLLATGIAWLLLAAGGAIRRYR